MGNKPFTYYWAGKTLYFASEQQAILRQPEVTQVLNQDVVAEYLAAQQFSNSETLWQDIFRLAAAHTMVVTQSGPTLSRYWVPDLQASLSFRGDPSTTAPCCSTYCVACHGPLTLSPAK